MELQDFSPHLLLVQLIFKTRSPAIIDQRGAWVSTFNQRFGIDTVAVEEAAVEGSSEDQCQSYRLGTAQVVASLENFEEFGEARRRIREFAEVALESLDAPRVGQLRVRTFDLAATDSFDELRNALASGFGAPPSELTELVGPALSDDGWIFEFRDSSTQVGLRFGPMRTAQIKTFMRDKRDTQYPAEFLFLDVDHVQVEQDLAPDEAMTRLTHGLERNRIVAGRVANWLRGKVA